MKGDIVTTRLAIHSDFINYVYADVASVSISGSHCTMALAAVFLQAIQYELLHLGIDY